MAIYKNLVIQYDDNLQDFKGAGIESKWGRALIFSDRGLPENLKMQSLAAVIPSGASEKEICEMEKAAKLKGVKIDKFLNSALGAVEFYKRQKAITHVDKEFLVIDVHRLFTDICFIKNEGGKFVIKKTLRLDCGSNYVAECLEEMPRLNSMQSKRADVVDCIQKFVMKIITNINNMVFRAGITKGTLLLSGEFWGRPEAIQIMKTRYSEGKVISYKPEAVALLGCVYHLQNNTYTHSSCTIDNDYATLQRRNIWGAVNKLSQPQREGYWKLLEAIMKREKEVFLEGNADNLFETYLALRVDYPEIDILWSYKKSLCYVLGNKKASRIHYTLSYKKTGKRLLAEIDEKADNILRSCIGDRTDCSDQEIVEKLYWYMSKNYQYTKEKTSTGKYPEYAYTLETLLRCGVCHGYAISMIYLLRKLQIPICYVVGDADGRSFGRHAWNLVPTLDGGHRHLDITWDLEKAHSNETMKHFLLDDIGMKSRRHFWNVQEYPICN